MWEHKFPHLGGPVLHYYVLRSNGDRKLVSKVMVHSSVIIDHARLFCSAWVHSPTLSKSNCQHQKISLY